MIEKILVMAERATQLALELNNAGRWDEALKQEQQARRLLNFMRMERFR